jgi:predicted regulator of Ras-like GTPase activity (Roadblock/LC7/MglB family)
MLVGDSNPALRTQALEGGAVSYLEKPLDLHRLKEELRRLLVQTGFSADLDSFDLLDVIQIVSTSRKSIALLISTGLEERGMLCFHNGNLVWAEYGMLRGEEAFFALAAHKTGTVIHQPWNQQVQPNVTQPLSRLVLQAFQYRTKYNQMQQQLSGEQKVVVPSSFEQEDDTPFMVLTEHVTDSMQEPFPAQSNAFVNAAPTVEQDMPGRNGVPAMSESEKEWWEQTGKFSGINVRPTPTSVPATPFINANSSDSNGVPIASFNGREKTTEPHNDASMDEDTSVKHTDLPSWLTDQPTAADIPVVHPSSPSGSVPLRSARPAPPVTPIVPPPAEWQPTQIQAPVRVPRRLVEQRVKEMTAPQKALKPDTNGQKVASPEWQPPNGEGQPQSGLLQSLAPSRRTSDTLPLQQHTSIGREGKISSSDLQAIPRRSSAAKRNYNYAALVSALQTLGYSINGFIAAAVVSIDGHPIAQVAVDDLDMSRMCKHFSVVMKSVFQSLDTAVWGACEDVVITSAERHILLRVIGNERSAFQVLVTTRDAKPSESGAVMANVEGAIAAALR